MLIFFFENFFGFFLYEYTSKYVYQMCKQLFNPENGINGKLNWTFLHILPNFQYIWLCFKKLLMLKHHQISPQHHFQHSKSNFWIPNMKYSSLKRKISSFYNNLYFCLTDVKVSGISLCWNIFTILGTT